MPTREQLNIRPDTNLLRPESSADFMAGDMRINEHPFLTSIHTGIYVYLFWIMHPTS